MPLDPLDPLGQAQLQPPRETDRQCGDDDAIDVSVPQRVVDGEARTGIADLAGRLSSQ